VVISQSGKPRYAGGAARGQAKRLEDVHLQRGGSMVTREAAGTIYTHAGGDRGASTKAFTANDGLFILAMHLGSQPSPG